MKRDLEQLGATFKALRKQKNLTQQDLAQQLTPPSPRTTIAFLEQGRRLPSAELLEQIAELLGASRQLWEPFVTQEKRLLIAFEERLADLVGQPPTLERLHKVAIDTARDSIARLFGSKWTQHQAYDALNRILVYYGLARMSLNFFNHYFSPQSFDNINAFQEAIEGYQKDAIRLFSTFSKAYQTLNATSDLQAHLAPLQPRSDLAYRERKPWTELQQIEEDHLPDLGYISAVRIRQELKEREVLSRYLKSLAKAIRLQGAAAVAEISPQRQRKMDALLRKFDTKLPHGPISPLFSPDPSQLEKEAARVAPSGQGDLDRIAMTQRKGLANLAHYLTADYMDVYVATSMRTDADFVSVNRFVSRLFSHQLILPLHLRYFNPTQSWIEDRVAKGLVEALMLRRADFTFYMAQKTDTFGKDSEASVALGQGKPVIVYVPRLWIPEVDVDTDQLAQCNEETLKAMIHTEAHGDDTEIDDTLDLEGLHAHLLTIRLRKLNHSGLITAVQNHWADFDLYAEADRINDPNTREIYGNWLDAVIHQEHPVPPLPPEAQRDLIRILVAVAMRFERRARVFREVHPLALQVILSTGVLNGILVARSIDACATLLNGLIKNQLDFELQRDEDNHRLIEVTTRSTVRVIPRNTLIANAFDAFYY